MKKIIYAIPALASVSAFADGGDAGTTAASWVNAQNVSAATSDLVSWGGLIIAGIGGVIAAAAGIRLLVKGINRAVGK